MDDPRDTFRAALEEEWGDRHDRPGLEERVASRLTEAAGGARHRRERWIAVSAAALGVVLVGALGVNALGLLAAGKHHVPVFTNPVTHGSPIPMPSPTVAGEPDYGPAPVGTPLFYYVDPRERTWMVAMDWTGQPRGTLKLPERIEETGGYGGGVLLVAPDGSRLFLGSQVVDAQGHATSGALSTDKQSFSWADDSRHLCQMSPQQPPESGGLPLTLMTFLPGGPPRGSGRVGTLYNQAGAQPYACSFLADHALVVQAYNQAASDSWLVRLSNGAVLHHQTYPGDGASSVGLVATHDGAYVAANTTVYPTTTGSPATAGPSVIRSGVSGARLATMPAGLRVTGFSWDGSLAVLQGVTLDTGPVAEVRVVDWRTGRVVWRLDAGKAPGSAGAPLALDQVLAGPAGRDLALSFLRLTRCPTPEATPGPQRACGTPSERLRDIILVHGDGSSQEVATRVQPVW